MTQFSEKEMQDIIEQKKKALGTRSEFFCCLQDLNSENKDFYESQTSSNLDKYLCEYVSTRYLQQREEKSIRS